MNNGHDDMSVEDIEEMVGKTAQEAKAVIGHNDLGDAFRTPNTEDTTRMLLTSGTKFTPSLFMKGHMPNNRCAMAMAFGLARARAHHDNEIEETMLNLTALLCSVKGRRAALVSDTIIGEKHSHNPNGGPGLMGKFKQWVGGE